MASQHDEDAAGESAGERNGRGEPDRRGGQVEQGELRAAERSAERAAELAATEGFHPLRLRPYVVEPAGGPAETAGRPPAAAGGDGPAPADPQQRFPATYSGIEYAPRGPEPADAAPAVVRGRHRRHRRGVVIATATVAASALAAGAVAVTGQVMGAQQGTQDRSLPDLSTSMPDVELPHDAAHAQATAAPPVTRAVPTAGSAPTPAPTPTASPSASPSATVTLRAAVALTTAAAPPPAAPATTPAPAASTPPSTAPAGAPGRRPVRSAPAPATPAPAPVPAFAPDVLQLGDTGGAVADLQRDLRAIHLYRGPLNGRYTRTVELSVATFQLWHHITDPPLGTYGPTTRAALARTVPHHRPRGV
ncbi:peptidoglycan-binding domain-containing protein [Actinacidiphila sp. ITFR-21]|uniref:peptidoglycan-binding domain-containing protein n=1 Tax=Actinacidiphila sp. ITFR-21 TaxID=3075199 RepID=UPI00288C3938|nr:peptidoglycan-binding domain-containing protein [Streptomyces sp. ITFR-21]WNI15339.1 peptidoglycan-binding domain-containing protein [Streptomyces sp. ITFR-21]